MNTATMSDKEVHNAYQADQEYLKRVDDRVQEIMRDDDEKAGILNDNFMHLAVYLAALADPQGDALDASKRFYREVERLAREQAEREIKPDDMDGYVEPLE